MFVICLALNYYGRIGSLVSEQATRIAEVEEQRLATGQSQIAAVVVPANQQLASRTGIVDYSVTEGATGASGGECYILDNQLVNAGSLGRGDHWQGKSAGIIPSSRRDLRDVRDGLVGGAWSGVGEGDPQHRGGEVVLTLVDVLAKGVELVVSGHVC